MNDFTADEIVSACEAARLVGWTVDSNCELVAFPGAERECCPLGAWYLAEEKLLDMDTAGADDDEEDALRAKIRTRIGSDDFICEFVDGLFECASDAKKDCALISDRLHDEAWEMGYEVARRLRLF